MEIVSGTAFLEYLASIRGRTMRVVGCIPPEKLEWTFRDGKFTLGDLARHIAAVERYMFAETLQNKPSRYAGCGRELADGYDAVLALMEELHAETVEIISHFTEAGLQAKCMTPAGVPISTGKWLRAMIEHEVHHRGQIYTYLSLLDVHTPPLYGLTEKQVRERSAGNQ
jgi:uncharacterized damage-inducible protein DinB